MSLEFLLFLFEVLASCLRGIERERDWVPKEGSTGLRALNDSNNVGIIWGCSLYLLVKDGGLLMLRPKTM